MGKFRKKPVVIEATQWFKPGDHPAVVMKSDPNRYADAGIPWIETLESGHVVTPGDWIITGVKGEHYPCKPDIFAMTYEPADDTQHRGDSRGGEGVADDDSDREPCSFCLDRSCNGECGGDL